MKQKTPYWWTAIKRARARGRFTDAECERSHNWVTCACGRQDGAIPRFNGGCPVDAILWQLGNRFTVAVHSNSLDLATDVLIQIEKRAAEVLAQREAR